jgi:hypothetical protein
MYAAKKLRPLIRLCSPFPRTIPSEILHFVLRRFSLQNQDKDGQLNRFSIPSLALGIFGEDTKGEAEVQL